MVVGEFLEFACEAGDGDELVGAVGQLAAGVLRHEGAPVVVEVVFQVVAFGVGGFVGVGGAEVFMGKAGLVVAVGELAVLASEFHVCCAEEEVSGGEELLLEAPAAGLERGVRAGGFAVFGV